MQQSLPTDSFVGSVFEISTYIREKPDGSRFFLGETVLHRPTQQQFTVCDLSNFESDYYGLWPIGYHCAVPTHGSYGQFLESIATELPPHPLGIEVAQ